MDYSKLLERMRDARSKRSKSIITKKFFDTVRQENGALSWFDANLSLVRPYTSLADGVYTTVILTMHEPRSAS